MGIEQIRQGMVGQTSFGALGKMERKEKPAQISTRDTVTHTKSAGVEGVYGKPQFKVEKTEVLITRVTPSKKKAAKENEWSGINKPIIGTDEKGNKVVFKHNTLGIFARVYPPSEMRERDVKEIVASRIMADEFKLPTVTYREGEVTDDKGQVHQGIVCNFVDGLRTLENTPPEAINDPDTAVAQSVVKGWMGDWDLIKNDSNVWIDKDGTPLAADFGFSIFDGITDFKVPNANEKVMTAFSKSENVDPIVNKIKNLSDKEIQGMVHRAGTKHVRDWNPKWEKEFSDVLIRNRDRLKKDNPFDNYYNGFHPFLKKPLNKLSYPLIFFTPEFQIEGAWGHPEVVLDTFKALAGVYHMPIIAKFLGNIEEKIIARQDRAKMQAQG